MWWIVSAASFILFALLLLRRRWRAAKLVGLCSVFAGGALAVQLPAPAVQSRQFRRASIRRRTRG
ncbi:MAG: hypothetical protein DMG84_19755 [Acidobacteria bacterium]|nr:MAG: hypothetical protein DMG84_19755 [Acidobacteriota bacterium]